MTGTLKLHKGDRRGGSGAQIPGGRGGMIGNAKHIWSPAIAYKAEVMAAQGVNQEVIAFACDTSMDTLRRHYKEQLDKGAVNANFRVTAAILESAEGERVECDKCDGKGGTAEEICAKCGGSGLGKEWRREPNTTAQIWWSKNRMNWTDKERIEHVGDGGGPVLHEVTSSAETIKSRLAKISERLAPPPPAIE